MRTLSANLQTKVADDVTTPGFLVEIAFAEPLKMSTRGTLDWGGSTWIGWPMELSSVVFDTATIGIGGTLNVGDFNGTLSALIMTEGIRDREIAVHKFYGDAPEADEAITMYAGVCDGAQISWRDGRVAIRVVQEGARTTYAPRRFITEDGGFHFLPADGTVFAWNRETYILEREK